MDWVRPPITTGTPIFIQLIHCHDSFFCDDFVLFDAFDFKTDTRWCFLHDSYPDAYGHAERLGLANDRMRDFRTSLEEPYFEFEILVFRPGETFKEFFQTRLGFISSRSDQRQEEIDMAELESWSAWGAFASLQATAKDFAGLNNSRALIREAKSIRRQRHKQIAEEKKHERTADEARQKSLSIFDEIIPETELYRAA